MNILAIDPGKSGGLAWGTDEIEEAVKMPATPRDLFDLIAEVHPDRVYLELVGGFIGSKQPGSAMFNFGNNFGHCQMAVIANHLPLIEVRPQKWQKALSLGTKGARSTTQWKNHLKNQAQMRHPNIKVTLQTADALLIWSAAQMGEI